LIHKAYGSWLRKNKVYSASETQVAVKLEARMWQGAYESIISYKQHCMNALKAYHDQGNLTKNADDQAMDFFHGLDNGRCTDFKVNYLNNLKVKAIEQPKSLNEMFTLVNNWLKPKLQLGGGYGSTFATKVDKVDKKD
jgi:hypothetical protein